MSTRRTLEPRLRLGASQMPIVTLTGPRQSGKTTLCRAVFADKPYATLEDGAVRQRATRDPLAFLESFPDGAVLDEVQRAPDLFSYLQVRSDRSARPGEWILTGSQHFLLLRELSQSLAGRTAIFHLLPFELSELRAYPNALRSSLATLLEGAFPRIHELKLAPSEWLADYVATYLDRDVRDLLRVGDLSTFHAFLQLAAGRTAQVLNISSLASDVGVSPSTIRSWISVLETSFTIFLLRPQLPNVNKRVTRAPKLHFYDSGLACHLLRIREEAQLEPHPLRGSIFESWVVGEIVKQRIHRGRRDGVFFYRDRGGLEVDLVIEDADELVAVEVKSSRTPNLDAFASLDRYQRAIEGSILGHKRLRKVVVYAGDETIATSRGLMLPWNRLDAFDWIAGRLLDEKATDRAGEPIV